MPISHSSPQSRPNPSSLYLTPPSRLLTFPNHTHTTTKTEQTNHNSALRTTSQSAEMPNKPQNSSKLSSLNGLTETKGYSDPTGHTPGERGLPNQTMKKQKKTSGKRFVGSSRHKTKRHPCTPKKRRMERECERIQRDDDQRKKELGCLQSQGSSQSALSPQPPRRRASTVTTGQATEGRCGYHIGDHWTGKP